MPGSLRGIYPAPRGRRHRLLMTHRIYFAGSISGGRGDRALYTEIIALLRAHGTVLTEHIGAESLTGSGEALADREIHDRDLEWLRSADFMVAEVSTPSLGVGYEIARATEWGLRVLCLHRPGAGRLSAMIAGCESLTMRTYAGIDDVRPLLADFFAEQR